MKKRGLSEVITILIVIVLTLVVIGVIWIVLSFLISEETEISEAQSKMLIERVDIKGVQIDNTNPSNVTIALRKLTGRLVLENTEIIEAPPTQLDIISVADLSGSMRCSNLTYPPGPAGCFFNQSLCEGICGGIWLGPINNLKQANLNLVSTILENDLSRVGLVAYNESIISTFSHDLDDDLTILQSIINSWFANGSTCISCGISNATERFQTQSLDGIKKAMIVMSDGIPGYCIDGTYCGEERASQETIEQACLANSSLENFTIYSVGLGNFVNATLMINIANCGNGQYFPASNVNDLIAVYETIANQIIEHYRSLNKFNYIKIVFYTESESTFRNIPIPNLFETKIYNFDLTGDLTPPIEIIKIEVYPVIVSSSGKEIIGAALDIWKK